MEPFGGTVTAGDGTFNLLREQVQWQANASQAVHVVPLSDLGLEEGRAEIWIRLELTAPGLSASTTRLVPIEAPAWNGTVFERVRQARNRSAAST